MELSVQIRENLGKGHTRIARTAGMVPAELYGHNTPNLHLLVNAKELLKVFKAAGESSVVQLVMGSEKRPVLIHDIQKNALAGTISHADFYQVKMDEKISASIQLHFVGEPGAVKEKKGTLIKSMHEIEVEALPGDLPPAIEINLVGLAEVGQSIHIKDIVVGKGVKVLAEAESVVATIVPLTAEEVVETGPTTVDEVKVEGEEKRAEREKESSDEKGE